MKTEKNDGYRGREGRGRRDQRYKLAPSRYTNPGGLMQNVLIVVNNTVL